MTASEILKTMGYETKIITAWKLVQVKPDGLHPIGANTHRVFPVGEWLNAADFNNPNHTNDPWFHAFTEADEYYLTRPDYKFIEVEMQYTRSFNNDPERPDWVQGKRMRIISG